MIKNRIINLIVFTSFIVSSPIFCTNYKVPMMEESVVIDGILDENIWQDALQLKLLYEVDPGNNKEAEVETTVYIVDTGKSILFGFIALDPDPTKIRSFLSDRDSAWEDDYVGIRLDTYNDELRALEFLTNPHGVQMDLIRDESNGIQDPSWDAIWSSAGTINKDGYVVEVEIPYTELQMSNIQGEKTWGVTLFRSYPRNVYKTFQNHKIDRNISCRLCQTDKLLGFENIERGLDLEVTPSITLISRQNRMSFGDEFSNVDNKLEPSIDINWGINSNMTLNATINPDFSQVESDSAQLDVNQTFALFYPEKRPFFLESSDYFNTSMNLIHTRNVADPEYGIRLVGKRDENAYGIFYTNDTLTNILIPGTFGSGLASLQQESDNLAARYRRDLGGSSTIGGLITHRTSGEYSNTVASIDSSYRISDVNTISFQYASTKTKNPQQIIDDFGQKESLSGNAYTARFEHNGEHWFYAVNHADYDEGFRADLGFIGKVGYSKTIAGAGYTFRPDNNSNSWWNRFWIYSDWDITHDQHGRLIEKELEGSLILNAGLQSSLSLNGYKRQNLWNEILFDENNVSLNISFQPISKVALGFGHSIGENIDFSNSKIADSSITYIYTTLKLNEHIKIDFFQSHRKLKRNGGNVFIANQADLRLSYQFNKRQRLRISMINTNVNRDPSLYDFEVNQHSRNLSNQIIYSYKVNPKTLLFLGYSDQGFEVNDIDLLTFNRTLFMKFSYAWKL